MDNSTASAKFLIKLRHQLLLLLNGIDGYCHKLTHQNQLPHDDLDDFLDDVHSIQEEILSAKQIINAELSGIQLDLSQCNFKTIEYELRNNFDVIIQSCEMAKDYAHHFNAEREIIEITRAARYFLHLIERDLHHLPTLPSHQDTQENLLYRAIQQQPITLDSQILMADFSGLDVESNKYFDNAPFTVDITTSLDAARTLLQQKHFNLIILDVGNQQQALTFIQFIRQWYNHQQLPITLLIMPEQMDFLQSALQVGINHYLLKPLSADLLLTSIQSQCHLQHLSKSSETLNLFTRGTLGSYLTDDIVDCLLDNPQGLGLTGEKCNVTILFSDLRGFTSMSEHLDATSVVELLNIYLSNMIDVISQFHGIVDTFMGDGMLILFGAPLNRKDDAENAVACAIAMQLAMASVNEQCKLKNLPNIEMGIGINTGFVSAGNIGSIARTKYSVIGRHVNLAARVESHTIGGQIYITENTLKAITSKLNINATTTIQAKGVERPITLYDVAGIAGKYQLYLTQKTDDINSINQPLTINYNIMENKTTLSFPTKAQLIGISQTGKKLLITTTHCPNDMASMIIRIDNIDDIYAKVTKVINENQFEVTITGSSNQTTHDLLSLTSKVTRNK